MKRITAATAVALGFVLLACTPTPTITATPSTLRPGCTETTTVTGKVSPVNSMESVFIEYQPTPGGEWKKLYWFANGNPGTVKTERWTPIRSSDGSWTVTYYRPQPGSATLRLRARGVKKLLDEGWVSKSWYVTPPTNCG